VCACGRRLLGLSAAAAPSTWNDNRRARRGRAHTKNASCSAEPQAACEPARPRRAHFAARPDARPFWQCHARWLSCQCLAQHQSRHGDRPAAHHHPPAPRLSDDDRRHHLAPADWHGCRVQGEKSRKSSNKRKRIGSCSPSSLPCVASIQGRRVIAVVVQGWAGRCCCFRCCFPSRQVRPPPRAPALRASSRGWSGLDMMTAKRSGSC
jgi:hypothetical protein